MIGGTLSQPYLFAAAVYSGMAVGLVYSVLRRIRHLTKAEKFLSAIFDVIFFLLALSIVALSFYFINGISLEYYIFLGLILGFCMYFFGVRKLVDIIITQFKKKSIGKNLKSKNRQ